MTKKIQPSDKEKIEKKRREFLNDLKSDEHKILNSTTDGKLLDRYTK
ncbi:MAG: hypothetical protein ACI9LM_001643 [Alteromonadaceae bacterium]|jgi:hypothetical protein